MTSTSVLNDYVHWAIKGVQDTVSAAAHIGDDLLKSVGITVTASVSKNATTEIVEVTKHAVPKWFNWATVPFFVVGAVSVGGYIASVLWQNLVLDFFPVNLKKKYGASWALVTGASSGIGKAITEKLAGQGINVVMAALDDDLLASSFAELTERYPDLQFRKVGVNLAGHDFMPAIEKATSDIDVTLVFNNAGFITTGLFEATPIGRSMANFNCNASAILPITHHFLEKMTSKGQKGLFAYTSSSAGLVPSPLSVIYPSTKSFMTFFATSLAPEIKSRGIDVVVVHPSPMATNFFQNSGGLEVLESFKRFAVGPEVIADVTFNSAGRFVVRDQGWITILLRIVTKVLDFNLFAELICRTAHTTGDFKKFLADKNRAA